MYTILPDRNFKTKRLKIVRNGISNEKPAFNSDYLAVAYSTRAFT